MKLKLNLSFLLLALAISGDKSYSLTDYQMKNICKKEINQSNCIKFLKEKKSNLKKGNLIEIPVIPYKGK